MSDGRPPEPGAGDVMPVGAWVRLEVPGQPPVVGFTYVDPEAGFSAQGWALTDAGLDQSARVIVRLPLPGVPWRPVDPGEVRALGLDTPPGWVAEFYGPQPPAGTSWGMWRTHPHLAGRFLPDYPDDLQVFVHDGGPRLTKNRPEAVWVRVTGMDGDVFRGTVLNQPHHLRTVRQGQHIKFVEAGAEHPVMVTDRYLAERPAWTIHPCRGCGLSELFDAPSDLIRAVFPTAPAGAVPAMFTAFCPLCGGVQGVEARGDPPPMMPAAPAPARRPWWKFWR